MRFQSAAVVCVWFLAISVQGLLARDVQGVVTDSLGHPRQYVYFGVDQNHILFDQESDSDGRFVLKNVSPLK